jgi:hypothetical protein
MKELYGKQQLIIHVIGVLIALGLLYFGLSFTLGFLLGIVASDISILLLEKRIDVILGQRIKGFKSYLNFMIGNLFLIVPLTLAVLWPNVFNLLGVGLGILYLRYSVFIKAMFIKGKDQ